MKTLKQSDGGGAAMGGQTSGLRRGSVAPEAVRRRCAVTRHVQDCTALIRFVRAPDGAVAPDIEQTLPGRGVWVGAQRELIERACRAGALARVGRAPPDLPAQCERALVRRALSLLGLARRAGQLAMGREAVRGALKAGEAAVLVQASDGAADGRGKLERLRSAAAPQCAAVALFDRAELAAGAGREAIHMVIRPGGLAAKFIIAAERLAGFRTAPRAAE